MNKLRREECGALVAAVHVVRVGSQTGVAENFLVSLLETEKILYSSEEKLTRRVIGYEFLREQLVGADTILTHHHGAPSRTQKRFQGPLEESRRIGRISLTSAPTLPVPAWDDRPTRNTRFTAHVALVQNETTISLKLDMRCIMSTTAQSKTTQRAPIRAKAGIATAPPRRAAGAAAKLATSRIGHAAGFGAAVSYYPRKGVDDFVRQVFNATPMELVEAERTGVAGYFLKDLSKRLEMPAARVFTMLGVPKATAEKKSATGEVVSGSGGQAAIGVAKLLGTAQAIVANSTAAGAENFDSAKWLGHWLERPQPALGGRKPADLIDTPTGIEVVSKLLGAIESGAFQ